MKILSYNCCALPVFTEDIPERLELIGEGLAELQPDVITLQEVFFPTHVDVLRERLPDYHVFSAIRPWRCFGGGLTLLSKHPLRDPEFVPFDRQGSYLRYTALARLSNKGFVTAVVEPEDGPAFSLIATHPVADYNGWRKVEDPTDRGDRSTLEYLWKLGAVARGDPYPSLQRDQLAQLAAHVRELPRDRPLLVAGDLNVPPESELLAGFLDAAGLEDCMSGCTQPSFVDAPYYRLPYEAGDHTRVDYVLHRSGAARGFHPASSRIVFDRPRQLSSGRELTLSDHFGVLVHLRAG